MCVGRKLLDLDLSSHLEEKKKRERESVSEEAAADFGIHARTLSLSGSRNGAYIVGRGEVGKLNELI